MSRGAPSGASARRTCGRTGTPAGPCRAARPARARRGPPTEAARGARGSRETRTAPRRSWADSPRCCATLFGCRATVPEGGVSVNILMLSREYPPHIYGGAGVAVDQLSRALARRASVEVRCFGDVERSEPGLRARGYPVWDRLAGPPPARYAPALEALSVGLAMARDPVTADVVHSHTWYAALGGLLVGELADIPLVVTLHSIEPLRPWKE